MTAPFFLPLDPARHGELADALGDSAETVIAAHHLRRGSCRAYVAGKPASFRAAIVQHDDAPTEPIGFGDDPELLDRLLQGMQGWDCVCVAQACADGLGELLARRLGTRVRYLDDIYFELRQPAPTLPGGPVRLLTPADLLLLEAAPPELHSGGFGSHAALLREGVAAAAVVEERIVAIARTSARTGRRGDIGVNTLEGWRGRGFATATAALVAQGLQAAGQVPVWSAGGHNRASLRVAEKLGFAEIGRRRYVILDPNFV